MFITQEDIAKKTNDRIKEVLLPISVDFDVDPDWYEYALKALRHKSARDLGLTGDEYKKLAYSIEKQEIMDCYSFAGMNNEIEERTPIQLGLEEDLDEYGDIISYCQDLAFKWDEQTKELRQRTINSVMEETIKRQQRPPMNGMPN